MYELVFLDLFRYYFPRRRLKTTVSSSPPPPSLLPPHCQPLPDIFSGVVAYLHGYAEEEEEERRERERYLVAYNGDVSSAIDQHTTHVICRTGAQVSSRQCDWMYNNYYYTEL